MTGRRNPEITRQSRVRGDARRRELKGQVFRLVAAILVVGSRLMVTPSEGALFSPLSTQEARLAISAPRSMRGRRRAGSWSRCISIASRRTTRMDRTQCDYHDQPQRLARPIRSTLRTCQEIIESTFERVKFLFTTTTRAYNMLWW